MSSILAMVGRTLIAAALLGATLGALGSAGLFFWKNREMIPCATAGLDCDQEVAAPMTDATQRAVITSGLIGGGTSAVLAAFFVVPTALRLRRFARESDAEVASLS
jgi:hypothetical protein